MSAVDRNTDDEHLSVDSKVVQADDTDDAGVLLAGGNENTHGSDCSAQLLPPRHHQNGRRIAGSGRLEMIRARLEGSRRSARECRMRRKLRYQRVADLVVSREKAIQALRWQLDMCKKYCAELDAGHVPKAIKSFLVPESSSD